MKNQSATWLGLCLSFGIVSTGCLDPISDSETSEKIEAAQDSTVYQHKEPGVITGISNDESTTSPKTEAFVGSCDTHKGRTAGWITCNGSGTVRLIIDCTAPQITDYKSAWTTFAGFVEISGECTFGINLVKWESK